MNFEQKPNQTTSSENKVVESSYRKRKQTGYIEPPEDFADSPSKKPKVEFAYNVVGNKITEKPKDHNPKEWHYVWNIPESLITQKLIYIPNQSKSIIPVDVDEIFRKMEAAKLLSRKFVEQPKELCHIPKQSPEADPKSDCQTMNAERGNRNGQFNRKRGNRNFNWDKNFRRGNANWNWENNQRQNWNRNNGRMEGNCNAEDGRRYGGNFNRNRGNWNEGNRNDERFKNWSNGGRYERWKY